MRRAVAVVVASMLAALVCGSFHPASAAGSSGPLQLEARIGGQVVGDGRLVIDPTRETDIDITVRNETSSLLRVKTVRLSGTALALTFFAYDTTVAFDVPAGATVERSFPLDLADLDRQATGLLPATVQLLSPDRTVLSEVAATSDVRGSVWSVFGVFGIAVVVMTLLAWAGALFSLARGRLPANRWRRALRFLPAGFGTGLSAVITLSVLRLVAPAPAAEIPMVLGAAAAAFLLGYLTPHPNPTPTTDESDADRAATDHLGGVDQAHGQYPAGLYPPGQFAPAQPGQQFPGQYPAGQLPPGLQPHGEPGSPAEQPTEAHQVPTPAAQAFPPPATPQSQPVRPKQQWPSADADATVDADATMRAGLLSDFLDRPDGRR